MMEKLSVREKSTQNVGFRRSKNKNIDNLEIVSSLIDEIGVVEIIEQKLGIDKREKVRVVLNT
jgi:Domain of unknown function (DUF4277)